MAVDFPGRLMLKPMGCRFPYLIRYQSFFQKGWVWPIDDRIGTPQERGQMRAPPHHGVTSCLNRKVIPIITKVGLEREEVSFL